MPQRVTKAHLTAGQRRLVEWMQWMYFGRIEGLRVQAGEPVLSPPPRVIRIIDLVGERGPHPMLGREDFVLKNEVLALFAQMKRIGNGVILLIEVRHGLPVRMSLEEEVTMEHISSY
jgi:hypothetical protein